ncbi:MAG: ABC transporter permease [Clostridia bacterium]|nr:ABC transporter permease [Clostridia bacterium]
MIAILKREFKSYLHNVSGFIFIAFLLLFVGFFTAAQNLFGGSANFAYALYNVVIIFLLIVPILTMRAIAEEKHTRTDQLLYSLPIRMSSVVIGKYLAMICVFLIPMAVICLYPFLLSAFGIMHYASAYSAILGLFLLGSALIAICTFISSLTESQIIAAVISFGVLLAFYLMNGFAALIPSSPLASFFCMVILSALLSLLVYALTKNFNVAVVVATVCVVPLCAVYMLKASLFEGLFPALLSYLAVFDRFYTFVYGIFDMTAVIYYLSVIVFFLFLTVQVMEKKRWS